MFLFFFIVCNLYAASFKIWREFFFPKDAIFGLNALVLWHLITLTILQLVEVKSLKIWCKTYMHKPLWQLPSRDLVHLNRDAVLVWLTGLKLIEVSNARFPSIGLSMLVSINQGINHISSSNNNKNLIYSILLFQSNQKPIESQSSTFGITLNQYKISTSKRPGHHVRFLLEMYTHFIVNRFFKKLSIWIML